MTTTFKLSRRAVLATSAAALAMPFVSRRGSAADKGEVRIYNWVDYIGETTLADFEQATGIKPIYDTYDAAETAQAKLMAGHSGYDIVDTASTNLPRFIPGGVFTKLDYAKIPNASHLDPAILKIVADRDPGNQYGIPYMWGTTGVTYNTEMVEKVIPNPPYDSLDLIFKPEYTAKLAACGINIIESPEDVIPMALAYLGKDPNSEDPKDLDEVVKLIRSVRKDYKTFDAANYLNALPNKELCVSMTWSGDYATAASRAAEAGVDIKFRYEVPKSGAGAWFDVLTIPADAKNVDNAHAFLNFICDPEVIAKCTNFTHYANANKDAGPFIDKDILSDPAIYPTDEVKSRLWVLKSASQKYEKLRTRAWNKIKTGT